ncbi:hypothetical protein LCGC14_2115780 [marine sediment metagenome]|uniref:Uncharacterized protein n=1 Tax=marine sediment metagenome TaxID=412755 RepID=A0A0F9H231_9ZZZZ
MSKDKIAALEIKHALMYYFRFKRQWICASECMNNDVMVDTKKAILDIEVKISKSDLWIGEELKIKHKRYKSIVKDKPLWWRNTIPNKFYICTPPELNKEAIKWVKEVNPKYGIIICTKTGFYPYDIFISKSALKLHKNYSVSLRVAIGKRVCSENIGLIGNLLEKSNEL